jgi:undecaprenyl-diphosphatase
MISLWQAAVLGTIQGISELFPISSLGHSVILPHLLGWRLNQNDPFFLTFLVSTHLATALVLVGFFWRDWQRIVRGIVRSLKDRGIERGDSDARLGWLLVVATIPAGVLGLIFEDNLRAAFASAVAASFFLALNGLILFGAEILRKRSGGGGGSDSDTRVARMSWAGSLFVGLMQSIALLPGFSRTGASMSGALLIGLSHEDAARFSFLLATPIIGAAALLKLPELRSASLSGQVLPALVGVVCAAIAAYLSVRFLVRYFRNYTLTPFAIYCLMVGLSLTLFFLGTGR